MNNTVIFFGGEKAVLNLIKYNYYDKLIKTELITITSNEIYDSFPQLPNTVTFKSNWKARDIFTFNLHLLLLNYLRNNNKGLFYDLRAFVFGPYKIKSLKLLLQSLKFFIKALSCLNFYSIVKHYPSSFNLLLTLRKRRVIEEGDYTNLKKILEDINASRVITISNFRDPKLFDLALACKHLNIELHLFLECWDNISTGYGVPFGVTHIYSWSSYQNRDFYRFNFQHPAKIQICGSYRRSYAEDSEHKITQQRTKSDSKAFKILYLEGYFYENLNYSISKIINAIESSQKWIDEPRKIEIIVRKYPLKRQSIDEEVKKRYEIKTLKDNNGFIEVKSSTNRVIDLDLNQADLILSELTTAGLESAFRRIPVVFIGSNSSVRFLDSMAGYNYSFAKPIKLYFELINLSKKADVNKLTNILQEQMFAASDFLKSSFKLQLNNSDLNEFSIPFNVNIWNELMHDVY